MKRSTSRTKVLVVGSLTATLLALSIPEARAATQNVFERIEQALATIQASLTAVQGSLTTIAGSVATVQTGVAAISGDVNVANARLADPNSGLVAIKAEVEDVKAIVEDLRPSTNLVPILTVDRLGDVFQGVQRRVRLNPGDWAGLR